MYTFERFTKYMMLTKHGGSRSKTAKKEGRGLAREKRVGRKGEQKGRIQRRACNGRTRGYIKARCIEVYNGPSKLHLLPLSVKICSGTRIPGRLLPPSSSFLLPLPAYLPAGCPLNNFTTGFQCSASCQPLNFRDNAHLLRPRRSSCPLSKRSTTLKIAWALERVLRESRSSVLRYRYWSVCWGEFWDERTVWFVKGWFQWSGCGECWKRSCWFELRSSIYRSVSTSVYHGVWYWTFNVFYVEHMIVNSLNFIDI